MLTLLSDSKGPYKLINGEINSQSESFWKQLWKLRFPCKVRNFIWRCSSSCLPTQIAYARKRTMWMKCTLFVMPQVILILAF